MTRSRQELVSVILRHEVSAGLFPFFRADSSSVRMTGTGGTNTNRKEDLHSLSDYISHKYLYTLFSMPFIFIELYDE